MVHSSLLSKIIKEKQKEIEASKAIMPLSLIENMLVDEVLPKRGFYRALRDKVAIGNNVMITELQKSCPVRGVLCENYQPSLLAKNAEKIGVTCLSVATDSLFFQGSENDLDAVREATSLPVLRKDFIIDEYQVFESCAMGADCITLLAACLSREQLYQLTCLSYDLGLDVIVSVQSLEELEKVAGLPVRMVGINHRSLNTFERDETVTAELVKYIPTDILVIAENAIDTHEDVVAMNAIGVKAFLLEESLMKEEKLLEFFN